MRRGLLSVLGFAWLLATAAFPASAGDPLQFGAVSDGLAADATSVGFEISGEFGPAGGAVLVGEVPPYVDPQEGLLMTIRFIAKAGNRLLDQCEVGDEYPIRVTMNGATLTTTAGRCREFLRNPCAESICAFWSPPEA